MSKPECVYGTRSEALMASAAKNKRVLAWIVLASFSLCSWSCYSWKKTPLMSIQPGKKEEAKISAVQTKSGEKINLNKYPAARIRLDSVFGEQFFDETAIAKLKTQKPRYALPDTPFIVTTRDGVSFRITSWTAVNRKIIRNAYVPLSIPLSEIDFVWIGRSNVALTVLLSMVFPDAIFLIIYHYRPD